MAIQFTTIHYFNAVRWRINYPLQDSRMVVEKYKSGFQPQGDIPFEDLSCSRQSSFQGGGGDKGDAASVNGSVMGSISQVIII